MGLLIQKSSRQAKGGFRLAPHALRLGTTPQRLLLQG